MPEKKKTQHQPHRTEGYSKWQTRWRHLAIIDRMIRSGRYPNRSALKDELEVSLRTVQRDIDFLIYDLGAPIEYDRKKGGYCYIEKSWTLPAVQISEGELLAVMLAQKVMQNYAGTPWAKKLASALERIAGALPERVDIQPDKLSRMDFSPWPVANVPTGMLDLLLQAISENRTVEMTYYSMYSQKEKNYKVNPYVLRCYGGVWYMAGQVAGSDYSNPTLFNAARIRNLKLTATNFDYDIADFKPDEYFGGKFGTWHTGERVKVKLEFNGPASMLVTEQIWSEAQKITRRKNGNTVLEIDVASTDEILHWILSWGPECSVISPKSLKDDVREMITEMYKKQDELA